MRTFMLCLCVMAIAAAPAGCDFSSKTVDLRATVSGPVTLRVGESHQYTATVEGTPAGYLASPNPPVSVEWSSSNTQIATILRTDFYVAGGGLAGPGGLLTAKAVGEVIITATPRHTDKFVRGQQTPGTLSITIVE